MENRGCYYKYRWKYLYRLNDSFYFKYIDRIRKKRLHGFMKWIINCKESLSGHEITKTEKLMKKWIYNNDDILNDSKRNEK